MDTVALTVSLDDTQPLPVMVAMFEEPVRTKPLRKRVYWFGWQDVVVLAAIAYSVALFVMA